MPANINFLRDRIAFLKKKSRKVFFIRTWSLSLLAIYGALVIGSFFYHFLLKNQNNTFKEKMKKEEKAIESLSSIETKQVYLASKVESLSQILKAKRMHQEIVESLFFILPQGISIDNFHISEDGTVNFSGACSSLRVLDDFLNTLEAQGKVSKMLIKEAEIEGVSYGFEQEYKFGVSVLFYLGKTN